MVNVTLSIDEETLRRVRIHALKNGTSLNAIVRKYLEQLVGDDPSKAAGERIAGRAAHVRSSSGPGGRTWRRDDIYDV